MAQVKIYLVSYEFSSNFKVSLQKHQATRRELLCTIGQLSTTFVGVSVTQPLSWATSTSSSDLSVRGVVPTCHSTLTRRYKGLYTMSALR